MVNALHRRALGYTVKVRKAFKLKKPVIEDGKKIAEEEVLETTEEDVHVPADTKAVIFWLTNRIPELWKSSPDARLVESLRKPNRELLEAIQQSAPKLWAELPEGCEAKDIPQDEEDQ